jgi:hypothetical protein
MLSSLAVWLTADIYMMNMELYFRDEPDGPFNSNTASTVVN